MKKNKIEPKIKETKTLTNQEKVLKKIEELKKILYSRILLKMKVFRAEYM